MTKSSVKDEFREFTPRNNQNWCYIKISSYLVFLYRIVNTNWFLWMRAAFYSTHSIAFCLSELSNKYSFGSAAWSLDFYKTKLKYNISSIVNINGKFKCTNCSIEQVTGSLLEFEIIVYQILRLLWLFWSPHHVVVFFGDF